MSEDKQEQVKQNLKDGNQWMRIVYMLLFWIALYFALMVTGAIIFIQVLFALFTGSDNKNLRKFAAGLANYINQIVLFLTYNDDRKPFPFAEWGKLDTAEPKVKPASNDAVDEHEAVIEIEPKNGGAEKE